MNDPRRNITKCYALSFAWGFIVLSPIMVPFFQSRGVSLGDVFIIQAAFGVTLGLLDIPTGYFSDRFGRRLTLVIASLLRGIGATVLVFAGGFHGVLAGYVMIGAANSFLSGSNIALLYESHAELQGDKPSLMAIQGHSYFLGYVSITIAALVGGYLGGLSIETAAVANCVMAWLPLPISLGLEDPATRRARATAGSLKRVLASLFADQPLLRAMVLVTVSSTLAPLIAAWTLQALWQELAFPIVYFGVIAAAQNIISALSGRYAERFLIRVGWTATLFLLGVLPIAAFFGTSVEIIPLVIACTFLFEVIRSLVQVVLLTEINQRVLPQYRATSNSVISFCSRMLYFVLGPVLGHVVLAYGAAGTLRLFSGVYVVAFLGLCLPLMRRKAREAAR